MTEHEIYTKEPVVIWHEEGHKFPRSIDDSSYNALKEFIQK